MDIQKILTPFLLALFFSVISERAWAKKCEPSSPPTVVVSIKPIHSLVCGIMEGVGQPELLMTSDTSPHVAHLKPSEEQRLYNAQIIIWVGENYEGGLRKRIQNIQGQSKVITLMELDGIHLYPYRHFTQDGICPQGPMPCCPHPEGECNAGHHHEVPGKDGHIWLAPNNATVIVKQIAEKLASVDPKHAACYIANSEKVIKKIHSLAVDIQQETRSVKGIPYFTFHDFTQYFDRYFGTICKGVIRVDPNVEPSPKHMQFIQDQIIRQEVMVLFTEPQFDSKLISLLVCDVGIHPAQLDYLGYGLQPGPDLYFDMMRRFSHDMTVALKSSQSPVMPVLKDLKERFTT